MDLDYRLLLIAAVLFALSFVPVVVAGRTSNRHAKVYLLFVDGVLTAASTWVLWYVFPTTTQSLIGVVAYVWISYMAGSMLRELGHDPYGTEARKRARKTAKETI